MCYLHAHKKAKYYVTKTTENTQEYSNQVFCSRCAIKLVTQGLKVEEITSMPVKKVEIDNEDENNLMVGPEDDDDEEAYQYNNDQE